MSGLAILCPGQGGQHPGMFDRFAGDAAAERVLGDAASVLGEDPRALVKREAAPLFENRLAQPLVCVATLAAWAVLAAQLPRPRLFAGYSVGELAAYGCAGALSAAETLRLAVTRAACMDAAGGAPAGLLAVRGLGRERIEALCAEHAAVIAIVNGPEHFVLGARAPVLADLETAARARGARRVRRLPVTVAAHTPWLREAGAAFAAALGAGAMRDPPVPVLAGVSGAPVRTRVEAIATLSAQLYTPVDWRACLQAAWEMGARVFLELGPGSALTRIAQEELPEARARSIEEFNSLQGIGRWVTGALAG